MVTALCSAQLMAALAAVGPPNPRADPECCSILHGLVAAVEALCKITEYQHEARTTLMENAERVGNRGRIICITNAKRWAHGSVGVQFLAFPLGMQTASLHTRSTS